MMNSRGTNPWGTPDVTGAHAQGRAAIHYNFVQTFLQLCSRVTYTVKVPKSEDVYSPCMQSFILVCTTVAIFSKVW